MLALVNLLFAVNEIMYGDIYGSVCFFWNYVQIGINYQMYA